MNTYNTTDIEIIAHLRKNSRINLTKISKTTLIPISTIFDRIKKYENNLIKKSTVIVDFKKLGYELKVNILLKSKQESRDHLRKFLESDLNINKVYRINNGYDFMVEGLFRNLMQLQEFQDKLENFQILSIQQYYILEEIKEEGFISEPELARMVQ